MRLASARGVPGTAGPLVRDARGQRFLLCNHHVVFGGGAVTGDSVWAIPDDDPAGGTGAIRVGRAGRGQLGRVTFRGETIYVDCALIELDDPAGFPAWLRAALAGPTAAGLGSATRGQHVHKHGGATGTTEGRIVDTAFSDRPEIDGVVYKAPRQVLVDSVVDTLNFSAPGDSGAAVLDDAGRIVGLLWGCNGSGQGVASPIGAVLDCLAVELDTGAGGSR